MASDWMLPLMADRGAVDWLMGFVSGYLAVLVTPGPNLLAVAALAATRGFRAALPVCLGLALGAMGLAAAIAALSRVAVPFSAGPARPFCAALLVWVAWSTLRGPVRPASPEGGMGRSVFGISAGFVTAVLNSVTAAYFLSAFLSGSPSPAQRAFAVGCVFVLALSFMAMVATVLARPSLQSAALRRNRAVRWTAALLLTGMAVRMAWV